MFRNIVAVAVCGVTLALGSVAAGDEVLIDGTLDDVYSLVAVQTVETGFGNNLSEWNAAYTHYDAPSGLLNVFLAGNLESNFNKLEIFIDSRPSRSTLSIG